MSCISPNPRPPGSPRPWGVQLALSFIAHKRARDYASLQAPACLRSPSGRLGSIRFNLLTKGFPEVSTRWLLPALQWSDAQAGLDLRGLLVPEVLWDLLRKGSAELGRKKFTDYA